MKTPIKLFLWLALLISTTRLCADADRLKKTEQTSSAFSLTSDSSPPTHSSFTTSLVTASHYCDFLNHVATEDPHHLYDEKMGTDPQTACIVRCGKPGHWNYEVIAGREDFPIYYINRLQASSFTTSTSNFNSHIEDVSSNSDSLEIEVPSAMLMLASSPSSQSTSNSNSYIGDVSIEEIGTVVGVLGLAAFGHELMMEPGDTAAERSSQAGKLKPQNELGIKNTTEPLKQKVDDEGRLRDREKIFTETTSTPFASLDSSNSGQVQAIDEIFKRVETTWDSFSQAAQAFKEDPNDKTLKAAAAAAAIAFTTHDPNYADDTAHTVLGCALTVVGYGAADAAGAAYLAAYADASAAAVTVQTPSQNIDVMTSRDSKEEGQFIQIASPEKGGSERLDATYYAGAARDAADFAQAVYDWRFGGKPASLMTLEARQEELLGQAKDESIIKARPKTPPKIQEEMKSSGSSSEGSPESNKSSDISEGATTQERTSEASRGSKNEESETSMLKQKRVLFPEEVVALDELKQEEQRHAFPIKNPSAYLTRATKARKEGRQEEAKYLDKSFEYTQNYNQYHPYFIGALDAEKESLATKDSVALWKDVLNHAKNCIDNYVNAAEKLLQGDASYASDLEGKAASLKDIFDHRVKAAQHKTQADELKSSDINSNVDELSSLWDQASYCSTQAAQTRAPYDKKVSELWAQASSSFAESAETYEKIKAALDEGATDEADLWTQASKSFKISGEAFAEAAKAFIDGDHEKVQRFSQEAVSNKQEGNTIVNFVHRIASENQEIATAIKNSSLQEEWSQLSPGERKDKAYDFEHNASRATKEANEAYVKALKALNAVDLSVGEKSLFRNEAITTAVKAREAYSIMAEATKIGCQLIKQEAVSERAKTWWSKKFQYAEEKKRSWANAILFYHIPEKEGVGEFSAQDQVQFPYSRLLEKKEIPNSELRQKTEIRILKTMNEEPYVRIEEVINFGDDNSIISRSQKEMVANHFLVTLKEGETSQKFLEKITTELRRETPATLIEKIEKSSPLPSVASYRLYITPPFIESFEKVLQATQSLEVSSEPNYLAHLFCDETERNLLRKKQWNLYSTHGIKASDAWTIRSDAWNEEHSLEPVIVAVIDTGMRYTHRHFIRPDGTTNIWTQKLTADDVQEGEGFFSNCDETDIDKPYHGYNGLHQNIKTEDTHDHGTHCGGIIGGANHFGIAGVAHKIQLMVCKAFEGRTLGSGDIPYDIIANCIDYASEHGAKIINCSFGSPVDNLRLLEALERAKNKGIIIVAAAGNSGSDNDSFPMYPANYRLDNIISVSASAERSEGDILYSGSGDTGGSNYGKATVDLAAPGAFIYSTGSRDDNDLLRKSGTSMAAPHVTGALALMMAEFPDKPYRFYIDRLLETTDKIPSLQDKVISGGRLNLLRALKREDSALALEEKTLDDEDVESNDWTDRLHSYYGTGQEVTETDDASNETKGDPEPPATSQLEATSSRVMAGIDSLRNRFSSFLSRNSSSGKSSGKR